MLAAVDVNYTENYAKSACIIFNDSIDVQPIKEYTNVNSKIDAYIPGQFYKRELQPILNILKKVKENYELVIIDGCVWLSSKEKPGLGAYLYEALNRKIPVIGIAKNKFKGIKNFKEILRGKSKKPLYITTVDFSLNKAAVLVKSMYGTYRIPDLLTYVDRMSKK